MKHLLIVITIVALVSCGGAEERKAVYLEKSRLSMEAGDLDKARIELKNVLQIDPKDAQAYFLLGNVFESQKDYRKAFASYTKALELDKENLEFHAKIGRFYIMLAGELEKAIEKRDFILSKDPEHAGGLLLKAFILFREKNIDAAMKVSQDIFLRHPDKIENAMFLASLYELEKKYEDSLSVLNSCINKHPDNLDLKNMLANAYLMAGKPEEAKKVYEKILQDNPELFSNYVKLAMVYQKNGESNKAEELLRKAALDDRKDLKRKMVLVEFLQQTKGSREAIKALKMMIADDPDIGDLRLELTKLYISEKNLDEAEKVLESAVLDFSESSIGVKSRVYLANLYMQKENVDAALAIVSDALKISPNDSEVNFVKAKLQFVSDDYEGAIISLRIVIRDDQENIDAYLLLSSAYRKNSEDMQAEKIIYQAYEKNKTNIEGLLKLASYYVRNNNKIELAKIIDNCLSIDPNNYKALSYKSALLNEKKMFSEAQPYVLRMIKLHSDMPSGYIQSVPYLLAEGKKGEAISLLESGYKKVKDNFRILELLVTLDVSQKSFDAAENKVRSAIVESGEVADLYMLLTKVQLLSKKRDEAKENALHANAIKPGWNEPYLVLADIYVAKNQKQKTIDVLKRGLLEIKYDPKISLRLAKIYEKLGEFDAAIGVYEAVYKKHANNIIIVNNLAILLSEHRKDEDSLRRAKELADKLKNVNEVVILDTVGWVYYKVGNYTDAVNVLKIVVERSPDVAVFNYHLGMALYKTGDEAAAKTYLTSSLANNSDFRGKDDAEAHLKKLQ